MTLEDWETKLGGLFPSRLLDVMIKSPVAPRICVCIFILYLFMCCKRQLYVCSYNSSRCLKIDDEPKEPSKTIKVKSTRGRYSNE